MKNALRRAMMDSETYVVEMVYADAKGNLTRRVVSPIRFVGNDRFLGLCLCREEPRQFYLNRCSDIRLIPAAEVIMPVPMQSVPAREVAACGVNLAGAAPAMSTCPA